LSSGGGSSEASSRRNLTKGKVLDLGCGKGGDLQKWQKARAKLYYGLDIAETSIRQARDRATALRPRAEFTAIFEVLDCFSDPISQVFDEGQLEKPFDVVSMQFCMHYAFENAVKTRTMFENVTQYLRVGGRFIGTIPNSSSLMQVTLPLNRVTSHSVPIEIS
jgi:mRNA (guanine-N7-)-methyltransferase